MVKLLAATTVTLKNGRKKAAKIGATKVISVGSPQKKKIDVVGSCSEWSLTFVCVLCVYPTYEYLSSTRTAVVSLS